MTYGTSLVANRVGQTLTGTANDDYLSGYSDGTVMAGGAGNDTYYVNSSLNIIKEDAQGGIDTVNAWVSYALGKNIENLNVNGSNTWGVGNEDANRIVGGAGSQELFGGGGNDVLTGGAGADVFVMKPGNGNDTITDFEAGVAGGDKVRLGDYGFTSFSSVKQAMSQVGNSVVLKLGAESLTFLNHKVSDFAADDFQYALDLSQYKLSFHDEFDSLSLQSNGGTWRTSFNADGTGRTLSSNGEKQIYMDKQYLGLGVNPFQVKDGVLSIHADTASAAVKAATGFDYTSGMLSSKSVFAQTYGYFEVRAELPTDHGTWPAFWLLPANGSWPPEIDVFEKIGGQSSTLYTTSHSDAAGQRSVVSTASYVGDKIDGMHTYGVLWTADKITWYVDGGEVSSLATPADMHGPMYMVTNMAVGGNWPGNPDKGFTGADMKLDYIRAYELSPSKGGDGNDTLIGSDANLVLNGGAGNDTYVLGSGHGFKITDISGIDTITSTISRSLVDTPTIENLTLLGNANIDGTGNALANTIIGNSGNNTLDGGAGNDTLVGGDGRDILRGGAGNDILDGGKGADRMQGGSGNDTFLFHAGDLSATRGDADHIIDFAGSGGVKTNGEDDIAIFSGFGEGATITFVVESPSNKALQTYFIYDPHDASHNGYVNFQMANGVTKLAPGDYSFIA